MHSELTLTLLEQERPLIGTGGAMSDPRVIKKYPNRRLYDTVESRYITLADVRKLVVDRIDFVVIDKKSQNDITRSILLQVIADQEHTGEPVKIGRASCRKSVELGGRRNITK